MYRKYRTFLQLKFSCIQYYVLQVYNVVYLYRELYKKNLHDPDNHNGVITHQEPDSLECKVKWAIGSITMNKTNRGDGIPLELVHILKDDAVKVLHSICSKFGNLSSHKAGKSQFSFQSQRKAIIIFKLPHNCTHLTNQQSNAQNSPSQASIVHEL